MRNPCKLIGKEQTRDTNTTKRRMREQSNPKFLEHACIATRMIDKRRQLFDLQETFHVEKKNHDAKLAILKQKEDEYERQDMEFQKKLIHFENNNKESAYTRATQRLAEETKLCVAIDNDIAIILKLLEEKKAEEKRLAEDVLSLAAQLKRTT